VHARLALLLCGLALLLGAPAAPAGAVVGGTPTAPGEAPWAVALVGGRADRIAASHFCGGVLVRADTAVTAAHCLDGGARGGFEDRGPGLVLPRPRGHEGGGRALKLGVFARPVLPLRHGPLHRVRWVAVHPDFDDGAGYSNADLAVIRLRRPVPRAIPLALPEAAEGAAFAPGQPLAVFGWGNRTGRDGRLNFPRELHRGDVFALADSRCNALYGRMFNPAGQLCAGRPDGAVDACDGDSGGPLVGRRADGRPVLVGIVSFGEGCGEPEFPGVYTRVGRHRAWVAEMVGARGRPRRAVAVPR
jgi:secreted trypsin-like serine protease